MVSQGRIRVQRHYAPPSMVPAPARCGWYASWPIDNGSFEELALAPTHKDRNGLEPVVRKKVEEQILSFLWSQRPDPTRLRQLLVFPAPCHSHVCPTKPSQCTPRPSVRAVPARHPIKHFIGRAVVGLAVIPQHAESRRDQVIAYRRSAKLVLTRAVKV